jgi:hypothetical protein
MLSTFANTLKIPELRKRILITLGLVFISRLISMIPTPGVDWRTLQMELERIRETAGSGGGMMDWFNVFSGGALNQCAIGFLSIWPYISASIIIQLLTAVVPQLERLAREGDAGRTKLAQYTRYLTIGICVFQASALSTALQNPAALGLGNIQIVTRPGFGFTIMTTICMTAASLLVMWLADQITKNGIGNGTSLIIMINITSRLPVAILEAWQRYFGLNGIEATKSPVEKKTPALPRFFLPNCRKRLLGCFLRLFFDRLHHRGGGGFDQLEQADLSAVADAFAQLDDPGVAAVTVGIARSHFFEDLLDGVFVVDLGHGQTAMMQGGFFAEGDHLFRQAAAGLGLRHRGPDLTVRAGEQAADHVGEHRIAMRRGPAQFQRIYFMTHYLTS